MLSPRIARVVVVVLDGLRPDAIDAFGLSNIKRACTGGAHTLSGQTVAPSVTACAMTSVFTGASPERHGMQSDRFTIPKSRGEIHPLPRVLAQHGIESSAHLGQVPWLFRFLARKIGRVLGLTEAGFYRGEAREILDGAETAIRQQREGLILFHWPDADAAGHQYGWMSAEYGAAAQRMDAAFGDLVRQLDMDNRPDTLLIALADHGGGGVKYDDHDSSHPFDRTIPVLLHGAGVHTGPLLGPVSLLDVPATVLWAFGIPRPSSYAGQPILEAFAAARAAA
jgi:predicted AlkP superfamily pyrophosphatase or phosphodiesterase